VLGDPFGGLVLKKGRNFFSVQTDFHLLSLAEIFPQRQIAIQSIARKRLPLKILWSINPVRFVT